MIVVDNLCDSKSALSPSIDDRERKEGDLVDFIGECCGVGRTLGVKSEFSVYPGEGIGRDEGRIRLTPRPTFP
jgi:hypothetical protein